MAKSEPVLSLSNGLSKKSASQLQKGNCMKRVLVGFVAAVSFAGCGVGIEGEDAEYAQFVAASGQSQQALDAANPNAMEKQGNSMVQPRTGLDPRALPQDPMPFHGGKIPRPQGRVTSDMLQPR